MKKFLLASLVTTTAIAANAGSLNFDARADYDTLTYQDSPSQNDSNKFYFKTIRLNYEGKVNDDLSFRLRGAYNKNGTVTTGAGDNSQTALEFAYISHKMSDWFTLQVGKIGSEFGGFEAASSGADLYLTSQAYTKTGPAGALTGAYLSSTNLLYVVGAKAIFTVAPDQTISVVAFKTPDTTTAGTPPAQASSNASMQGVIYKGSFLDNNALKVMASYHHGSGAVTADTYDLISAGFNWAFAGNMMAGIDYVNSAYKQDSSGNKDTVYSIIGKFAYTGWEQWTPRLEVTSSEEKIEVGTPGTNKFMGYGAVLEYKPIKDTNFRYHVAYSQTKEELATGGSDAKVDEITVGARLYADFLK